MSPTRDLSRRAALIGAAGAGGLLLTGCDQLSKSRSFIRVMQTAERLNLRTQRLLLGPQAPLAPEYTQADLSPIFKANGSIHPAGDDYQRLLDNNFADWRLAIDGLVAHPLSLSLAELRALPARSQITRHDCVEGWSAIGGWTGVPLNLLLKSAVLHAERLSGRGKRLHPIEGGVADLPNGAMIAGGGHAFLIARGEAFRWSPAGYAPAAAPPDARLLTPPSTLAAIRAGYRPVLHPSVGV